jgi:hypothetical protein
LFADELALEFADLDCSLLHEVTSAAIVKIAAILLMVLITFFIFFYKNLTNINFQTIISTILFTTNYW